MIINTYSECFNCTLAIVVTISFVCYLQSVPLFFCTQMYYEELMRSGLKEHGH